MALATHNGEWRLGMVGTIGKILKKASQPGGQSAGWLFSTNSMAFFKNFRAFLKNFKKATGRPAGRTTLRLGLLIRNCQSWIYCQLWHHRPEASKLRIFVDFSTPQPWNPRYIRDEQMNPGFICHPG
jgi:hypothetical protein